MTPETLANTYQAFGIYAVLAILSIVVVYLYRRIESLQRGAIEDAKKATADTAKLASEASAAIVQCTQTLSKINESIDSLREDMTELRVRLH